MIRAPFAFYNLAPAGDPNRGPARVTLELNAIANNVSRDTTRRRPKVIGVCEAIDRPLPQLPRYQRIRSTVNPSRANIALYVRDDVEVGNVLWIQHTKKWKRPLHPGFHEPRATLVVNVEDWTVIVGHAPQAGNVEGLAEARDEWLEIMGELLHRPGPSLALTDPNGLADDLQHEVPGLCWLGTSIEAAHGRRVSLHDVDKRPSVNGVAMLSDHKGALLGEARVVGR